MISVFGECGNWSFLSNFPEQLRRKDADVSDIHFTLLEAAGISPTLVLNENAKAEGVEVGSFSKYENQKLRGFYTQGDATFDSVGN